ncbi:MAG TPA: hypothetical protein VL068_02075, partial [Microthrixaceae bacterium]|nr:hypothetical protein [Microthrixaceae bacterium]
DAQWSTWTVLSAVGCMILLVASYAMDPWPEGWVVSGVGVIGLWLVLLRRATQLRSAADGIRADPKTGELRLVVRYNNRPMRSR